MSKILATIFLPPPKIRKKIAKVVRVFKNQKKYSRKAKHRHELEKLEDWWITTMQITPCGILTKCTACAYENTCNFAAAGTCKRFVPSKRAVGSKKWNCDLVEFNNQTQDLSCCQEEYPFTCTCIDEWEQIWILLVDSTFLANTVIITQIVLLPNVWGLFRGLTWIM